MQFANGCQLDDFIDKDVHVIVTSASDACDTLPLCFAFLHNGRLCIDLVPQLRKKYVVEVPDSAVLSTNEVELAVGRYGVIIPGDTYAGKLILDLLAQKRRQEETRK